MGDPASFPQLIFEGMRGNTAYLDISLDAVSVHRGSCNRGEPLSLLLFLPPLPPHLPRVAGVAQGP